MRPSTPQTHHRLCHVSSSVARAWDGRTGNPHAKLSHHPPLSTTAAFSPGTTAHRRASAACRRAPAGLRTRHGAARGRGRPGRAGVGGASGVSCAFWARLRGVRRRVAGAGDACGRALGAGGHRVGRGARERRASAGGGAGRRSAAACCAAGGSYAAPAGSAAALCRAAALQRPRLRRSAGRRVAMRAVRCARAGGVAAPVAVWTAAALLPGAPHPRTGTQRCTLHARAPPQAASGRTHARFCTSSGS
jgi:hypothetical protein